LLHDETAGRADGYIIEAVLTVCQLVKGNALDEDQLAIGAKGNTVGE
jgi:hypothetical protein